MVYFVSYYSVLGYEAYDQIFCVGQIIISIYFNLHNQIRVQQIYAGVWYAVHCTGNHPVMYGCQW
jgi:hypothetical protein